MDGELSTSEDGQGDSAHGEHHCQEMHAMDMSLLMFFLTERELKTLKNLSDTEENNITDFLNSCVVNTGVLDVMYRFLIALSEKRSLLW